MRRSKQSEVILEELRKVTTHPRVDELYAMVRQRIPNISMGTVYRNIDRLRHDGMALEIYCGDFIRYDGNVAPHDHFLCRSCRRVWDFDSEHGGHKGEAMDNRLGFRVDGHYTVFHGLCRECLGTTS